MTPTKATYDQERGFTCRELVVVLVIVTLGFLLLLPALARTKTDSRAFQCLNNVRELTRAWHMQCDDSQGQLPYASPSMDSNSFPNAWVTGDLDQNPANQSNWNPDVDIKKSPLWKYCGNDLKIWKCPADQSYVVVNGVATPRVRSMAMNVYLGGWGGVAGGGELAIWKFYLKTTDFAPLPPSRLFVLHDMREDSIDAGEFVARMSGFSETSPSGSLYGFYDFPGMYHDGGGTFSFADGRVELHRWRDRRTTPPIRTDGPVTDFGDSPHNPDVAWLQERSTRPR